MFALSASMYAASSFPASTYSLYVSYPKKLNARSFSESGSASSMLVTSVVFSASVDSSFASASLVLFSTTSVLSIVSVVVSVSSTCADSTALGMDSVVAVASCFPQETKDKVHIVISAKIIFLFIVYSSLC